VISGGTAAEPDPAPAKAGYDLGGWRDADDNAWDFDTGTVSGNITLHAHWTEKAASTGNKAALVTAGAITIPAPRADGSGDAAVAITVAGAQVTIAIDGGAPLTAADFVITGDAIILKDIGDTDIAIGYVINADHTLTITGGLDQLPGQGLSGGEVTSDANSNLAQAVYTVSFDTQGANSAAPANQTVPSGGTAANPGNPTRTGYTFGGWYKEAGCANVWTFASDTVTADRTLYAKWTAITTTVMYNPGTSGSGTMANSSHTYGTTSALRPNTFTRTGHVFDGWATDNANGVKVYNDGADVTSAFTTIIQTLYAKWVGVTYTVRYNANGGTGAIPDSSHTYWDTSHLTANTFTRDGYAFAGWATSSGGAKVYNNAASAYNLATTQGAIVDLYAVWTVSRGANTTGISFTDQGTGLVSAPIGDVSRSGLGTLITITGSFSSIKWVVDGAEKIASANNNSHTLSGAGLQLGDHSLTIVVIKTGSSVPWTAVLPFTVTN
jgi:uncharacterized repeat protein (TIGR02543 family)